MDKIACSYYPTTAVFVDDSEHHLTQIALALDVHLTHVTLSNPQEALRYIQVHGKQKNQADIDPSLSILYTPNRFNEPSVLVVDYDMPGTGMDGFQLCEALKKLCVELNITRPKVILLTGQASENTALEGFNKGYIDRYISKKDPHYAHKINEAIKELQALFLAEQSAALFEKLATQSNFCLKDKKFLSLLTKIFQENHIAERHIVSAQGDFLLLKENGEVMWLVAHALAKEPDLVPIKRDQICSFRYYLDHIWPPN